MLVFQGLLGLLVFVGIAYAMSEDRSAINWKVPVAGIALQLLIAFVLLKSPWAQQGFLRVNELVAVLQEATASGTRFVFGYLGGGPQPFEEKAVGSSFILAFQALPLILVVSALTALLTYWRILPWVVRGFSRLFERTLGLNGQTSLAASLNIFVGMVESPLFIRPYLQSMSRSDLMAIMTAGMATIAGTVLVLYASILEPVLPGAAGNLLIASIISVPAAVVFARLMVPAVGEQQSIDVEIPRGADSSMDAIVLGTEKGIGLLINITAMLLVLVALVSLVNSVLGLLPEIGEEAITLQYLLGRLMAPIVWLMGIPWSEAPVAGSLMGTKTILNEMLAYLDMAALPADALSERSRLIMSYALCGFANPGSLGIMIAGMATMVPQRRSEIAALGLKSVVAGTLATSCTAVVVGLMI
jgi:CNT family concentrative nucleoside transporter